MSVRAIESVQLFLRKLCVEATPTADAMLLSRFVATKDREAFEHLLARHGPLVLGTARRLLGDAHDAEDVFQAVFLSLARQARSIRQGVALPAWLHQVTCRVAARVRANRRVLATSPPEQSEQGDPAAGLVWREVCEALDQELQRLPEPLRSPLLMCYLGGMTRDEAAAQLGWSLGTLKRRLEEGRNTLRIRLARRGIGAAGLALAVLTPGSLRASVSGALIDSSLALVFATDAVLPATVSALVISSASTLKGVVMKSIVVLLAFVGFGVAIYVGTGLGGPPKEAEGSKENAVSVAADMIPQKDDPLPDGSTLRFGASRFRHGFSISSLAVSVDGTLAVAVNDNGSKGATRAYDLITGRSLFSIGDHDGGFIDAAAISPDGKHIVTKQDYSLRIRDATDGKQLRLIPLPRPGGHSGEHWVAFTPDGKVLAVSSSGKVIHLIDFESGKTIRDVANTNPESPGWEAVLGIAFSPDSKWMVGGGFSTEGGIYFARLWDLETGKELRRFLHAKNSYGIPSLAFSPDAKTLATRSHDGRLRLFDVDSGKERHTFPQDGGGRKLGAVAFSPDGRTVAAAGGSIRLYEVTSGKELLRIERKQASHLHFADGGRTLTAAVDGAIYRWDAVNGKALTPECGDSSVMQVLVSADGRRVVTHGVCEDAHIWDGKTAKHLHRFHADWQSGMAISPDGRYLAWPVADDGVTFTDPQEPSVRFYGTRIRFYDLVADKTVDRIPPVKGVTQSLTFIDDGKRLVTVESHGGMVRIWDVETGKEVRSFPTVPKVGKDHYRVGRVMVSPDGKTVGKTFSQGKPDGRERLGLRREDPVFVHHWDVVTGKELTSWSCDIPLDGAFSPDGRFVLSKSGRVVLHVATGERVVALPVEWNITAATFSPDGRHLAFADASGVIHVWEVATWTKRNEVKGGSERATALSFGAEGQLLSGNHDSTVLVWETRRPPVADSVTLDHAWNDLAAQDAAEAFRTEGRFLASPSEAVGFFAKRIEIPGELDRKWVERLLTELDSDDFAVRQEAGKALSGLDERVTPHLEEALKKTDSQEVRQRVARLLEQRRWAVISPALLRQVRAVLLLERIGSAEARSLLKRWATGPAGARLTSEAAAAVQRLEAAPRMKKERGASKFNAP